MSKNRSKAALLGPKIVREATLADLMDKELFDQGELEVLQGIVRHSVICKLDAKQRLYPTREEVNYVYVIHTGYVALWLTSSFSNMGENFLAWRGPGQILGEMRAVGSGPTTIRIVACEPCELIQIRKDAFTDAADISQRIYRNIARLLIKKMEHERCRSEIIRMSPASRQVAQTLLHLAHERRGETEYAAWNEIAIPGRIHQDEIGGYIGGTRVTVNRELTKLKTKNLIAYDKSQRGCAITILDREELETVARNASQRPRKKTRTT